MAKGLWVDYQFVPKCQLSKSRQKSLAEMADKCRGGGICPYLRCPLRFEKKDEDYPELEQIRIKMRQGENECPEETSLRCSVSCAEYYEKNIADEEY